MPCSPSEDTDRRMLRARDLMDRRYFGMRDPFGNHLRVAQLLEQQQETTDETRDRWAGDAPVTA